MNESLTIIQAYKTMICFLENYYNKTLSDDLGSLLGDLQLLDDNGSWDPAAWIEWKRILKAHKLITILDAFKATINFLDAYYTRTSSEDIQYLLNDMRKKDATTDSTTWNMWIKCSIEVLKIEATV